MVTKKSRKMKVSAASSLPRFDEYFGAWGIEPNRGMAMFEQMRGTDLAAHIKQTETPRPSAKMKAEMVPMADVETETDDSPSIAVFEISGVLMKQESSMGDSTSYVALRKQVRDAMDSPACVGGLLCIDSPGGAVAGCSDLVADLKAFASAKPMVAFAEDLAASCGYRLACAGAEIYANSPEAQIGCIGTIIGLYDSSEMAKKEGIKAKVYATGSLKGAGFPGTEITTEQDAYFQGMVDEIQQYFSADVSTARKLNAAQMAKVSTGACFMATEAKALGLIDGIQSYEQCLARVAEMVSASGAGVTMEAQMSATQIPAPAAPASAVELKPDGKDFIAAFGDQGAKWFVEGKSFPECAAMHRTQVEAKLTALEEANAALIKERDELKARVVDLRGGDPVSANIPPENKTAPASKDVRALENRIGKNQAAFARSIKLPRQPEAA